MPGDNNIQENYSDAILDIMHRLDENEKRLNIGDQRFMALEMDLRSNTIATQQIAENTAGITRLTTELEAGTKFLCRLAKGVQLCLQVVDKLWKPILIVAAFTYWITHGNQLPDWFKKID